MFAKWLDAAKIYADRRMPVMLAFGFSSGFPLLLVGSTLTVWLQESQIPYALIGLFSLTRMPYGFKWIWSPLIDRIRLPLFERLGRRRGWALFIQLCMLAAILAMSAVNPAEHTAWMALLALIVAGCSASQDIVLDAYRIDSFETAEQGAGSAVFVLGYRLGMLFSGAFALWLTTWLDWREVYIVMALGALVGIVTVLLAKEPYKDRAYREEREKLPFKPRLRRFLRESVYEPFKDFMHHHRWGLILLFILLYRLSDEYKAPMAFVFYKDMGFSNAEIAYVSKIYGMLATIAGGLLGGIYIKRSGLPKALMLFGVLQGVTNLVYIGQAYAGRQCLYLVADDLHGQSGRRHGHYRAGCLYGFALQRGLQCHPICAFVFLDESAAGYFCLNQRHFGRSRQLAAVFPDCLADGAAGTFPAGLYDQKESAVLIFGKGEE